MSEQDDTNNNDDNAGGISRRGFLYASLAGAAGVLLGGKLAWAARGAMSGPATSMAASSNRRPAKKVCLCLATARSGSAATQITT